MASDVVTNTQAVVLWLGPAQHVKELIKPLRQYNIALHPVSTVEEALAVLAKERVVAAVVAEPDARDAKSDWRKLVAHAPHLMLIAAASLKLHPRLQVVLQLGFDGILDLEGGSVEHLAQGIERSCRRAIRATEERLMLTRLRQLQDDFLRGIIESEVKLHELSEQARQGTPPAIGSAGVAEAGQTTPPLQNVTVLVVDDEPMVIELFQSILGPPAYTVYTAEDGIAALRILQATPIDVLLTDKNLPGMNGIDLLRRVRQDWPLTATIIVTGYASMQSAIEAVNLGAECYLEKPFDLTAAERTIADVATRQQSRKRKQAFLDLFKERHKDLLTRFKDLNNQLAMKISPGMP